MTSDYKKRGIDRRDYRSEKVPEGDTVPNKSFQLKKKKNTKLWCKGKEGVEHKLKCYPYKAILSFADSIFKDWRVLACEVCGKEVDNYSPTSWSKKQKPDWVIF